MGKIESYVMEEKQKRYQKLYGKDGLERVGGVFRPIKRKQLLDLAGKSGGKDGTLYNFWYDVREYVKTALIDLQLFIETGNQKDVDEVINHEVLRRIIFYLLQKPSPEKYKIAQMLAEEGLSLFIDSQNATLGQISSIDDVIETTKQLTKLEIPKEEHGEYLPKRENPLERRLVI